MYYPRKPPLFFNSLLGFLCSSLHRTAWVALCLLDAFSDKNLQNF